MHFTLVIWINVCHTLSNSVKYRQIPGHIHYDLTLSGWLLKRRWNDFWIACCKGMRKLIFTIILILAYSLDTITYIWTSFIIILVIIKSVSGWHICVRIKGWCNLGFIPLSTLIVPWPIQRESYQRKPFRDMNVPNNSIGFGLQRGRLLRCKEFIIRQTLN